MLSCYFLIALTRKSGLFQNRTALAVHVSLLQVYGCFIPGPRVTPRVVFIIIAFFFFFMRIQNTRNVLAKHPARSATVSRITPISGAARRRGENIVDKRSRMMHPGVN